MPTESGSESSANGTYFYKASTNVKSHHVAIVVVVVVAILLFHFRHKIAEAHDRYRMNRRVRYSSLGLFEDDLEDGLSSHNFDLESNIESGDSRKGLLEAAKSEIKAIMHSQHLSFDDARLQYLQSELASNDIAPDGMPRDPKTVTFS